MSSNGRNLCSNYAFDLVSVLCAPVHSSVQCKQERLGGQCLVARSSGQTQTILTNSISCGQWPVGKNKDKICKDHGNGSKVMELYKDTMKYHRSGLYFHGLKNDFDNYCYSPCIFHSIKAMKTNQFDRNYTWRFTAIFIYRR